MSVSQYKIKDQTRPYSQYNNPDCGNCSVSWKLRKTPNEYKNKANDLINSFYNIFYDNDPEILDYYSLNIEMDFYNWLYNEFNN